MPQNSLGHAQDAEDYCKGLGFDAVHLWCPNSTLENHVLWMLHPDQPFDNFPTTTGIWTGIIRTVNLSNEDYWCDQCLYKQTYFNWRREGLGQSEPTFLAQRSMDWYNNPDQLHNDNVCDGGNV